MAEKEQISCRISDQLMHQLTRYASKENLKQTQIYERACHSFITWYDRQTKKELESWRARACAQTGTPYRGRILKSVKSRLQEIGEAHNHPLTDMYYTALVHLMEQEALEQIELITCFLEHSLFERCEQEVMATYIDRSEFVQTVCEEYVSHVNKTHEPPKESDHVGQAYPAYISSSLRHHLEELAKAHAISVVDVYHSALNHHFLDQRTADTRLVTGLVQDSTLKLIDTYIEDSNMNEGQFMESAATEFLKWYATSTHHTEHKALPPAPMGGQPLRGYIPEELDARMRALPHPTIDVYSMAILHLAHVQDISRATYLFGYADIADKNPTGGTVKLTLLEEQNNLIRLVVIMNKLKNVSEFCEQALSWWFERRHKGQGEHDDYFARITPLSEEDEEAFIDYNITTPYAIHAEAQRIANEDSRSLRTVYYNAAIRYLDHLLEGDELAKFVSSLPRS